MGIRDVNCCVFNAVGLSNRLLLHLLKQFHSITPYSLLRCGLVLCFLLFSPMLWLAEWHDITGERCICDRIIDPAHTIRQRWQENTFDNTGTCNPPHRTANS